MQEIAESSEAIELKRQRNNFNTGAKAIFLVIVTLMAAYFAFGPGGNFVLAAFFWMVVDTVIIAYDFTR